MKRNFVQSLWFVVVVVMSVIEGQHATADTKPGSQTVREAKARPDAAVDYTRVAKLKLASRKQVYTIGDLVDLHVAMLNISTERIYFHKLNGPSVTLAVLDENGTTVDVTPYTLVMEGVTPLAFELIGPDEILLGSTESLAGCTSDGLAAFEAARRQVEREYQEASGSAYGRIVFERNLFTNWGDSCIRLTKPGTYTLVVEAKNEHVVISSSKSRFKTAVGTIKSSPLTITILQRRDCE